MRPRAVVVFLTFLYSHVTSTKTMPISTKTIPVSWTSGSPCGIDELLSIVNVTAERGDGVLRHPVSLSFHIRVRSRNITSATIAYPIVW